MITKTILGITVLICLCLTPPAAAADPLEDSFDLQRRQMVEDQLKPRGIKDQRVLDAMLKVKRHLFRLKSLQALVAGAELHSPDNPDQACGKVVSGAPSPAGGWEALAVVQSNFAENLHLGSREGPKVEAAAVNL